MEKKFKKIIRYIIDMYDDIHIKDNVLFIGDTEIGMYKTFGTIIEVYNPFSTYPYTIRGLEHQINSDSDIDKYYSDVVTSIVSHLYLYSYETYPKLLDTVNDLNVSNDESDEQSDECLECDYLFNLEDLIDIKINVNGTVYVFPIEKSKNKNICSEIETQCKRFDNLNDGHIKLYTTILSTEHPIRDINFVTGKVDLDSMEKV